MGSDTVMATEKGTGVDTNTRTETRTDLGTGTDREWSRHILNGIGEGNRLGGNLRNSGSLKNRQGVGRLGRQLGSRWGAGRLGSRSRLRI